MSEFKFNYEFLKQNATAGSWRRGYEVYQKDLIIESYSEKNFYKAKVKGNYQDYYVTDLIFKKNKVEARCNCPLKEEWCKHSVAVALKAMEEVKRELSISLKKAKKSPSTPKINKPVKTNINALKPGMSVLITDLNDRGTILTIDKKAGTAQIQMGIMKTTSKLTSLVILEDETKKNIAKFLPQKNVTSGSKTVKTEVDLRGMVLEEALTEADMFLDRAAMSSLSTVTIIHGKGTGVLRSGIHTMLRKHPHVKSFRLGRYGEGENGVTVVELKNS